MRKVDLGHLARRRRIDQFAYFVIVAASFVGVVALAALLYNVISVGWHRLSWDFLTSPPSRFAANAGIKTALVGTLWLIGLTVPVAFPIGVATAVYLEEYARQNWLTSVIKTNISNLAGVPSIIYGLLGLAVFVRALALGRSVAAGALTMALLILPVIIINAQEAIKAVPQSLRHASLALGASKWQTVRRVVLPTAFPGILTGTILAVSRAIGETAPLITIGALTYVRTVPATPLDPFTVLPIQIFNWTSRPQAEFQVTAAAGIIVLLVVLLSMNAVAIVLRNKYQRKADW